MTTFAKESELENAAIQKLGTPLNLKSFFDEGSGLA